MAFTQSQLDALDEAIAHGVLEVKYSDKTIRYHSVSAMLRVRDLMRRDLGLIKAGGNRIVMDYQSGIHEKTDGND